jgi:hypothetical protein
MPTTIDCPSCGKALRLPDDLAAATVQCPTCKTTFAAADRAPSVASVADEHALPRVNPLRTVELPPKDVLPAPVADAPGSPQSDLRSCPYCHEEIPVKAAWCRHCGESLRPDDGGVPPWEREGVLRRDVESHRGGLILSLGIAGMIASGIHVFSLIGVPLSVAAWVMGQGDLHRMQNSQLDPSGAGTTQAGRICGIIGTCLGAMWWLLGGFLLLKFLA